MHCAKCGNSLAEGTKFCGKCGNTVAEQVETKTTAATSEKTGKKAMGGVLSVLAFIIAFVGFRYLTQEGISAVSGTPSKQEIIHQAVQYAKSNTTIPQKLDEVTTLTGIEEVTGAIHYDYVLHDIDESQVSNSVLKNILVPSVCKTPETKSILDKDIRMEYSYQVQNSATNYFVSLSKSDCL